MYSILIKIDGIEKSKQSVTLLHIVIGFFLITKAADYYRLTDYKNFLPVFPVYIVAVVSLVYGFARKRVDYTAKYNITVRLFQGVTFGILGILMIRQGSSVGSISSFLWAGLCLLLLFSERKIFNDTNLLITKEGLVIPGYYTDSEVSWEKLSDIIVREDYVTIFYKNNKYQQYQVMQSLSTLEVAQINGFCKEQLSTVEADNINIHLN